MGNHSGRVIYNIIAETNETEAKSKKGEKQKMSFTIKKSLIKERIYPFTEPNATPATI